MNRHANGSRPSASNELGDDGDEPDDAERAALHAAISRGLEQARAGRSAPAEDVLAKLRARRLG